MAREAIETPLDLGRRIAQGRREAGLTQADLADAIGVDRTAVAKMEKGVRKVSAIELMATAAALDRPVDWLVTESPPAVVSRRQDSGVGGRSRSLDGVVERISRDVEFLLGERLLLQRERISLEIPTDYGGCEALARTARSLMGLPGGPLTDLQRAVERVGLLGFSLDLGTDGGDGAYVSLDAWGVAVVNGHVEPGRRRFNLAHELGHHLVGDAYAPEVVVLADDETERMLNAFVAHLLMPREDVAKTWQDFAESDRRLGVLAIATRFRTSWTTACGHLVNLGLFDHEDYEHFIDDPPRSGDFVALGEQWVAELDPPNVPPDYGRRIVRAYRSGKVTAAKAVELLWGTIEEADLPEPLEIPLAAVRREFEPLR